MNDFLHQRLIMQYNDFKAKGGSYEEASEWIDRMCIQLGKAVFGKFHFRKEVEYNMNDLKIMMWAKMAISKYQKFDVEEHDIDVEMNNFIFPKEASEFLKRNFIITLSKYADWQLEGKPVVLKEAV